MKTLGKYGLLVLCIISIVLSGVTLYKVSQVKDGKNGTNGKDGADGKDGIDSSIKAEWKTKEIIIDWRYMNGGWGVNDGIISALFINRYSKYFTFSNNLTTATIDTEIVRNISHIKVMLTGEVANENHISEYYCSKSNTEFTYTYSNSVSAYYLEGEHIKISGTQFYVVDFGVDTDTFTINNNFRKYNQSLECGICSVTITCEVLEFIYN